MPPKRSLTHRRDDEEEETFSEDDQASDLESEELIEDEDRDEDEDGDDDEEDEEDEEEDTEELKTTIREALARSSIVKNYEQLFTLLRSIVTSDGLYEAIYNGINQSFVFNLSELIDTIETIIDHHFTIDETAINDEVIQPTRAKITITNYPSLFSSILDKNARTAIIGLRAQQIAAGADIYVEAYVNSDHFEIARRELKEGKIPIYIERSLPDGSVINVRLSDLIDPHF